MFHGTEDVSKIVSIPKYRTSLSLQKYSMSLQGTIVMNEHNFDLFFLRMRLTNLDSIIYLTLI